MINYKRVRRIKTAIYIFLLLLFLLPSILLLVVSIRMLRIMPELKRVIAESNSAYVQMQEEAPSAALPSEKEAPASEPAILPVPQGTSQAADAPSPGVMQSESPASEVEDTSRGKSPLAVLVAPDSQPVEHKPVESSPEQSAVLSSYEDILQAPNTGLPR